VQEAEAAEQAALALANQPAKAPKRSARVRTPAAQDAPAHLTAPSPEPPMPMPPMPMSPTAMPQNDQSITLPLLAPKESDE